MDYNKYVYINFYTQFNNRCISIRIHASSVVNPYHFDMDPDPDRGKADPDPLVYRTDDSTEPLGLPIYLTQLCM